MTGRTAPETIGAPHSEKPSSLYGPAHTLGVDRRAGEALRGAQGYKYQRANTRLQFINDTLQYVLGWDVTELEPEDKVTSNKKSTKCTATSEYIDYHLKSRETARLVVEAKRAGKPFLLDTTQRRREIPLRQLLRNHGDVLSKTIQQAQNYCSNSGTTAFVVTNGHQWVASIAFAHNVPSDQIAGLVFYDCDDLTLNLPEFIGLLSPDGMASQTLFIRAVSGGVTVPPFARNLNRAFQPGMVPNTNYLAPQMTTLMTTCFADLTDADHAQMLRECYVKSEVTNDYLKQLESFVGQTLPPELANAQKIERADPGDLLEAFSSGTSILVIGRVGTGKSTFLSFWQERLNETLTDTPRVILYLDLLSRTQIHATNFDHDRMVDEICSDLLIQAQQNNPGLNPFDHDLLLDIFHGDIQRKKSSLSDAVRNSDAVHKYTDDVIQERIKQPQFHLKAYLGHLARKHIVAGVILDNVDRGTEEFEKTAFKLAYSLTVNTKATVLTALRETTFHRGRGGFLDVGRHRQFTISPPPFSEVVRLRFEYVKGKLEHDASLSARFRRGGAGFSFEQVRGMAEVIAQVLFADNRAISECIQALAATNIRIALELLEDFCTSPHTDVDRLFKQYEAMMRSPTALGPTVDTLMRSLMRSRRSRYEEANSRIVNLFQVSSVRLDSHFVAIRILQYLGWKASQGRSTPDVRVGVIIGELANIGLQPPGVMASLEHLGHRGLVTSLTRPEPPPNEAPLQQDACAKWTNEDLIRIGAPGQYYLDNILKCREYIQNIVDDTNIYDEAVFDNLAFLHEDAKRTYHERVSAKAHAFLMYLSVREREELDRFGPRTIWPKWVQPVAEGIGIAQFGASFSRDVGAASKAGRSSSSTPPPTRGRRRQRHGSKKSGAV